MNFYPAFICEKGHVISNSSKTCMRNYCNCGSKIVSRCSECDAVILGRPVDEYLYGASYEAPAYCHQCGKPYPWTSLAIESTLLALEESKELSKIEIQQLADILPDVITETPRTRLAAVRIKKVIASAGGFAAECLKEFVKAHGCDLIFDLLNKG